jgi:hypothetical protein
MASDAMRADPIELSTLAATVLTASTDLGTALQDAQASFPPPADPFGNSSGSAGAYAATETATEQTGATLETLIGVLEGDVDRLYQVAFAYQEADEQAADECEGTRPC